MTLVLLLTPVFNIYSSELMACDMDNMSQSNNTIALSDNDSKSNCHDTLPEKAVTSASQSTCCCDDSNCGCMMIGSSFIQISYYSLNIHSDLSVLLHQKIYNTLTTFIPSLHKPPIA